MKDSPWVSILSLKVSKAESGGGGIQCNMTVLFHDMYIYTLYYNEDGI